jgi:hypothetical protein
MDIWDTTEQLKCPFCKQNFDTKGDHLYQCNHLSKQTKTKMHNKWRDMWHKEMETLIPYIHLTDTKIGKETTGLVRSIKNSSIKPFDTHFNLPLVSKDSHFRCKLTKVGFDITICNSDTCPPPSRGGSNAKSNNIVASLLSAEKSKFQRGRGSNTSRTDGSSQITLTGEQIIGELFTDNMQLLPFAISPLGLFGPTINHFLYGTPPPSDYKTLHNIDNSTFPNASKMARQAFTKTPTNILERANTIWKSKSRNYHYGGSYKSPDPTTYYTQIFGRTVCTANGSAGLAAIQSLYVYESTNGPISASSPNDDQISYLLNSTRGRSTSHRSSSQSTQESSQPLADTFFVSELSDT